MTELRFDGRVAVVTGGGRGMGATHAKLLAARGAKVVVNDLASSGVTPAQHLVDEINAAGGTAVANGDDVSTPQGGEAIIATALDRFGRVDIVVNNAGISAKGPFPEGEGFDFFELSFRVHLGGVFNVTRAAWLHFTEQAYGRVVNITSSALLGLPGDMTHVDPALQTNYGVSYSSVKAGMVGLTKTLANYGAASGIKVNAVAPEAATRLHPNNVTTLPNGETLPLEAELVSAGVALLAHDFCPATGEIFGVGGGKVDRVFLAATQGYVDLELSPERLVDHWDRVMDTDDSWIPENGKVHGDGLRQARAVLVPG
jgi:NAD(P)-dependent dehydrogenase (short-subunit alcohol dehydrogenase family)